MSINSWSHDPTSRNIACLTVGLVDNGPGFLGLLPPQVVGPFGGTTWRLPLTESFFATTLRFQGFHLDAGSGLFLATQRLSVPIDY